MCKVSLLYLIALGRYRRRSNGGATLCPPAAGGWRGGPAAAGLSNENRFGKCNSSVVRRFIHYTVPGASPAGDAGDPSPRSRNPGCISPALFMMDTLMLAHLIAQKNMNQIINTRIYNRKQSVNERTNDLAAGASYGRLLLFYEDLMSPQFRAWLW